MKPKFKILSIDGGGIKGIIPCVILKAIEDKTGYKIWELFNLIAGTSTGGIIALGLVKPDKNNSNAFSADDMLNMYAKQGKDIFSKRQEDLISVIGYLLNGTKYAPLPQKNFDIENMERLMAGKFGKTSLKESLIKLLITTYDLKEGMPFYFSTRLAEKDPKEDILMHIIARSTSAAPTYFEPKVIADDQQKKIAFVDGGVFANNPSVLAYAEAKELWKEKSQDRIYLPGRPQEDAKGYYAVVTPDDKDLPFYMLSLGCGSCRSQVDYSDAAEWRTTKWLQPLLTDIFMRGEEESTHYAMQHLLPPFQNGGLRYERINPEIPFANSQMDDVSKINIDQLIEIAEDFVRKNEPKIDQICEIIG